MDELLHSGEWVEEHRKKEEKLISEKIMGIDNYGKV